MVPFWLFRAVFLLPRPYEITSLKSNIVKSIEAYYMYSILLPFFYLFFFFLFMICNCCIIIWNLFLCVHYLLVQELICIICMKSRQLWFFVITHTCAQTIREPRFWWKSFLRLPVQWCKWHINIVSDFL